MYNSCSSDYVMYIKNETYKIVKTEDFIAMLISHIKIFKKNKLLIVLFV